MEKIRIYIWLVFVLTLTSCSTGELKNLYFAKQEVVSYYETGKYSVETKDVIKSAIDDLSKISVPDNAAAVFDIDETALSNYDYIKSIDFGYNKELWDKYIQDTTAKAIPEVKELYDWLIKNNVKIYFITGRSEVGYESTKQNLINEGYTKFEKLFVRTPADSKITAVEYKSKIREKLTNDGYKIIACVGDQYSDLEGGNTGLKVKIPNYLYYVK